MKAKEAQSRDARVHTAALKRRMSELIDHMHLDMDQVDDPRAHILFETSADVLQGLVRAYDEYDVGRETEFRL